jgi:hypothetical protein
MRRSLITGIATVVGICTLLTSSCGLSIPNLEDQQCSTARDATREFYSWYLGTDADTRAKQKDIHDRYVSPAFSSDAVSGIDPFLLSDTAPTTFKIGKCEQMDDSHVNMQVQLYWRHDSKTDQKEVYAEMTKNNGDNWMIDKVDSR